MELFSLKDFTDDGGYLKQPDWCVEHANKKSAKKVAKLEAKIHSMFVDIMGLCECIADYERVMRALPYQDVDPAYEPVRAVLKKYEEEK